MNEYLPKLDRIRNEIREGRNVYEGYQRSWGLEFGELKKFIAEDPDYQFALKFARGRSVLKLERMMNLFLLIKFFLPRLSLGNIVEFGSYLGGSALFMAALAQRFLPGTQVYALDTFSGMPKTDEAIDAHFEGDFADTNMTDIQSYAKDQGLKNIHLIKGLFQETAPLLLPTICPITLSHIDCDIYSSVQYSYDISRPYMMPMGYYVFDDATVSSCIGATEAVEKYVIQRDRLLSEQIYPHFVFRHPQNKGT